MSHYSRILVAIDLSEESGVVLEKAKLLAEQNQAELNLIHVVEIVSYAYGGEIPVDIADIQTQIENHAESKLSSLATSLGYPVKKAIEL
jgi:universal stress protein A